MPPLTCFKAYDIRGKLGAELDEGIAYRIARGLAQALEAKTVVLGWDARPSSAALAASVARGLCDAGCHVLNLGLSGTEEMYFATEHFGADAGICVTASHNPIEYNGMKMVRAGAAPLDPATDLAAVKHLAEQTIFSTPEVKGQVEDVAAPARAAYVDRVLAFIEPNTLRPLKVLVNAGHGAAGPTFDVIADRLTALGVPLVFERIYHRPDPTFPAGIPNPLLPQNRPVTAQAVQDHGADFGVAWDGDFDRCFFFDHTGAFVDGEYVVGVLAHHFLTQAPGATIIHDPRVIWNTKDMVTQAGGRAVQAPTGHAFIKQAMRREDAVYGGEMSAHHYFKDFAYCDSGMIPWLVMAQVVSQHGPLANLVAERKAAFPTSGEVNFTLKDPKAAIARVHAALAPKAHHMDTLDGLSFDMGGWRANLRRSNTEPLVRLNVETRGDPTALKAAVAHIKALLLAAGV